MVTRRNPIVVEDGTVEPNEALIGQDPIAGTQPGPQPLLVAEHRPGPGARVTRTAGQAGGAFVVLEVAQRFGWFHSDQWTADQWQAVTALAIFLAATAQNLVGWFRTRSDRSIP